MSERHLNVVVGTLCVLLALGLATVAALAGAILWRW